MIRHSLTTTTTVGEVEPHTPPPPPRTFDTNSTLRLLLTHLLHTIYLLLTFTKVLLKNTFLSLDWCRVYIAQHFEIRQRWERFKDAVFYEFMLFLFQPSVLMLVVMWPGWVLVIGLWLWSTFLGGGWTTVDADIQT
ncbi:hypothetical protein FN846DRAFT_647246 [Sphaerosporella brunnea]|uniref:Uncharacterized protein n=1 Tax=Sphaerosporella brunnea TaxID=1250544 RepID=A0A5J5EZH9_9PEZI|nr:hypothetical protein FN846DRAFT_647246 [Sphaerosporella brunnea]